MAAKFHGIHNPPRIRASPSDYLSPEYSSAIFVDIYPGNIAARLKYRPSHFSHWTSIEQRNRKNSQHVPRREEGPYPALPKNCSSNRNTVRITARKSIPKNDLLAFNFSQGNKRYIKHKISSMGGNINN